jgi:flavin-binding protein dodecin
MKLYTYNGLADSLKNSNQFLDTVRSLNWFEVHHERCTIEVNAIAKWCRKLAP